MYADIVLSHDYILVGDFFYTDIVFLFGFYQVKMVNKECVIE